MEKARRPNGRFGHQHLPEPDRALTTPAATSDPATDAIVIERATVPATGRAVEPVVEPGSAVSSTIPDNPFDRSLKHPPVDYGEDWGRRVDEAVERIMAATRISPDDLDHANLDDEDPRGGSDNEPDYESIRDSRLSDPDAADRAQSHHDNEFYSRFDQ